MRRLFQQLATMEDGEDFVTVDGGRPANDVAKTIAQALEDVAERSFKETRFLRHVEP